MVKRRAGTHEIETVTLRPPEILERKTVPMAYCCGDWHIVVVGLFLTAQWWDDPNAACADL